MLCKRGAISIISPPASHDHLRKVKVQEHKDQLKLVNEKKKKSDLFGVCCSVRE